MPQLRLQMHATREMWQRQQAAHEGAGQLAQRAAGEGGALARARARWRRFPMRARACVSRETKSKLAGAALLVRHMQMRLGSLQLRVSPMLRQKSL